MSAITAARRSISSFDIASRAAFLSFSSNALLMVVKITVGVVFGSVAVLGDGIDSAEDVIASAIAFFTVRLALQPADEQHPYGHGKAESLAAVSQAALIAGGAVFIAITATRRAFADDVEIHVLPSLVSMFLAAAINLGVVSYSLHAARVSGSVAIAADARHLMTNIVQAVAVVLALALVGITGEHIFDPIVALLLAAYLLWIALGIFRASLTELLDTALPDDTIALIESRMDRHGGAIRGYHALRTRKSGREIYIDMHALVDPAISVSDAHRLVEDIERGLHEAIPGAIVSVHVDPDEPGIMERATGAPGQQASEPGIHLHTH